MVDERLPTNERRAKILERINLLGLWNINQHQLAKEFGVTHQQISKDVAFLKKNVPPEDMEEIQLVLDHGFKTSLKNTQLMMIDPDKKIRLQACKHFSDIANNFTAHLENYGKKKKLEETGTFEVIFSKIEERLKNAPRQ